MTALIPHSAPTIAERPTAADPNIVGTRCDQRRHTSHLMQAPHEGCPGWWGRHVNDRDALTCACSCHEQKYGWPHWEQAVDRFQGH